jgi:Na+-transporting NADH:ubiquinone oxidoreductase subunit NqrB
MQALVLASLLGFIFLQTDFHPRWSVTLTFVLSALGFQLVFDRLVGVRSHLASAMITALSLAILLRASHLGLAAGLSALAIASKFLIRYRDQHFFNPSNFAIVMALVFAPGQIWLTAGQWGHQILLGFIVSSLAWLTLSRCQRIDIAIAFFGSYAGFTCLQGVMLGDPWPVVWHSLSQGSLFIFAFYMITDPISTPQRRGVRVAFGVLVAALAVAWDFWVRMPGGIFYALFAASCATPLANHFWCGEKLTWVRINQVTN